MDDFADADLGLDDADLGLDDAEVADLGLDELADPATLDPLLDPASEAGIVGDAAAGVPLGVDGTLGQVLEIEYYEETISWLADPLEGTSPEAAGVVGTLSLGTLLSGGARFAGAVRSARDVMGATRALSKKVGKKLPRPRDLRPPGRHAKSPSPNGPAD